MELRRGFLDTRTIGCDNHGIDHIGRFLMGFLHAPDLPGQCRLIADLIEIPGALDVHPADLENDAVKYPETVAQRCLQVIDVAAICRHPPTSEVSDACCRV